jgi:hypothetical protein
MEDVMKPLDANAVRETTATGTELDQLLAQPVESEPAGRRRIDGVLVGTLVGFRSEYEPLVMYPGQIGSAALVARTSVDLCSGHIGDEVTLVFEDSDPQKPIVSGRIRRPSLWSSGTPPVQVDVEADGKRLTVTAAEQLVLQCGKASITLTAAGKVLIQGSYLSSRSSGVHRIKGGSVHIN